MPRVKVLVEKFSRERALGAAGEFLHRVAIRVNCDSLPGRALARALGFVGDESLAKAAAAFCVSKQYLDRIQSECEAKLAGLRVIRPVTVHGSVIVESIAGPSGYDEF